MSTVEGDKGAASIRSDSALKPDDKAAGGTLPSKLSTATSGSGWTKVRCPCCVSEQVEPLVLVKLGQKVGPETKRWLIKLIGAPQKDGGERHRDCGAHVSLVSLPERGLVAFDCICICSLHGR